MGLSVWVQVGLKNFLRIQHDFMLYDSFDFLI